MEVVALVLSADGARDRAVVDRLVRASRDAALAPGEHETPLWAANFNAQRPYAVTQLVPGQTGAERLIDPLDGILGNDEDALQAVRQQLSQYGAMSPVVPPADTTYGGRPGGQPYSGSADTTHAGTAGSHPYTGPAHPTHAGIAGGQPYASSANTAHAGTAGSQPYAGSSAGDQPYVGGSGRLGQSDIPTYVDHPQAGAPQLGGATGAGRTPEAGGPANFRTSTALGGAARAGGAAGGGGPAGDGGTAGARRSGGDAAGRGAAGEVVRRYWGRLGNWVYLVVAVAVLVVFSFAYSIGAAVGSGVKDAPTQAAPPPAVSPEPYPASVLLPPIDRVTTAPYKRPDGKPGVIGASYPVGTDLQVITNAELPFALGWPRPPQVDYLGESSSLILRRIVTRSEDPDDKNGVDNLFKAQLALHPCVSLAQCLADRLSFDQQWTKLFKTQAPVTAKDPKTWVSVSNTPYVVTMTRAFQSGGQWWLIGAMVYGAPSEATDIQHVVNDIWRQTS